MNYEELENIPVDFVEFKDSTKVIKGKVVGCDPSVGVTVVYANNPKRYLLCLLGELAPQRKDKNHRVGSFDKKGNLATFNLLVKQIKAGVIINDDLDTLIMKLYGGRCGNDPTLDDCAFGQ